MGSEIRILIVSPFGDTYGGSQQTMIALVSGIDRDRFEPIVVVPDQGAMFKELNASGTRVHCIPANYLWFPDSRQFYRSLAEMRDRLDALVNFIREEKIDIVHTNGIWAIEGGMAARLAGIPHIWHVHCLFSDRHPIFEYFPLSTPSYGKLINDFSDCVVGVSDACVLSLAPYVTKDRLKRIYNGISFKGVIPKGEGTGRPRSTLGISRDDMVVCSVGRISKVKGFRTFIEAAVEVLRQHPAHFLLVGPEEDESLSQELKRMAEEKGIVGRVHFVGGRDDVADILAASDIFVSTSTQEAYSLVCVEAMATGLPVIATRSGGPEEIVVDGETGYLVNVGDSEAVAKAIIRCIADKTSRERMGAAGKMHARKFDMSSYISQWEELYEQTHSGGRISQDDCLTVDVMVNMLAELGRMGCRMYEIEWRVQQCENFINSFKDNPVFRSARKIVQGVRIFSEKADEHKR